MLMHMAWQCGFAHCKHVVSWRWRRKELHRLTVSFLEQEQKRKKDGTVEKLETVKLITSVAPRLSCGFCPQTFGNAGVRETHRLTKHNHLVLAKQRQQFGSVKRFTSAPKINQFPILFWKMALTWMVIGVCWKAALDVGKTTFALDVGKKITLKHNELRSCLMMPNQKPPRFAYSS